MYQYTTAQTEADRDRDEARDDYARSRDGRIPIAPLPTTALKRKEAIRAISEAGTAGGDCACGLEDVPLYPNDLCFECTVDALRTALDNPSPIALAKFYDRLRG